MRRIKPFALERWFARFEFSVPYLLSSSDCEPLDMLELLAGADGECRGLWESLKLGYTESTGHPLLRREIASQYDALDADFVLTAAPEEAILLAMHALLEPDDHVVCSYPGYQSLYEIASSLGCAVDRWTPRETGDGWRFDVEALKALVTPKTKLVVVNFPHNPTGALLSKAELEAVVELCRSASAWLFSDEMYRGLELDRERRLPAACDLYDRAISLGGLSKAYGLAGLRLGWLAARDAKLHRRLRELKDYTTICGSAPSEVLGLIALRSRAAIVESHRARLHANLGLLDRFFLRRRAMFRWMRPEAGSVAFPRFLPETDLERFCEAAAREAGVMLLPSTVFGFAAPAVRFGFGRANLAEGLERFEAFLDSRKAAA